MKSEWVKTEIAKACKREVKDGKRVLVPVDLAEEIRQHFIPDFSNWKEHDSYRDAFDRLVKDLKQSG